MSEQYFTVIRWHEEDLKECFEKSGIPATEENISIFLNSRAPKTLNERSTAIGHEIIYRLISDLSNEFCISANPELIKELIDIGWSGITYEEVIEKWNVLLSNNQDLGLNEIYTIIETYNKRTDKDKKTLDIAVEEIMNKLNELYDSYYSKRQAEYMSQYV
ncbi:hypothetical protein COL24_05290 [Bacillus toyonensis]|uniref:hypothetical protein n=1 Tax=Bacillus toyonensis TaxID=155322 RepID=UPI000BF7DB58|nr:hypothetical protein [Bacillus toyonensis]PFX43677.1 hypothetical protein COL24_05290 [Bacillus toyonensis]